MKDIKNLLLFQKAVVRSFMLVSATYPGIVQPKAFYIPYSGYNGYFPGRYFGIYDKVKQSYRFSSDLPSLDRGDYG